MTDVHAVNKKNKESIQTFYVIRFLTDVHRFLKALTDSNPDSRVIWRTIPATMPGCAIFERVF